MRAAPPRANLDEIRRALGLLIDAESVAELRIIATRRIVSGYYDDAGALARDASRWSGRAEGVYVTLNPVNAALLSRSPNRVTEGAKHTSADSDVLRRTRLLVDLDPGRPAGISSSEDEHAAAIERAHTTRAWLGERGWPAPVLADSGNGAHVVYGLGLPNDGAAQELVKRCLEALALQFDDERVRVDTTTHNAARISKVYGTLAAKGADTPERPHRLARILEAPDRLETVPHALLETLAALAPPMPPLGGSPSRGGYTLDAIEGALTARGLPVTKRKTWNGGTLLELAACPWGGPMHARTARVILHPTGAVSAQCFHASCSAYGWRDLRDVLAPSSHNGHAASSGVWPRAKTAAELLAIGGAGPEWVDFPIAARGSLTEINAPRGTGKSVVIMARMVERARAGMRVLCLDRDNSPASLRKRLVGLGARDVPTLKVLTRDSAPALADVAAWRAFPLESFDVVMVDAWDSFAEGAGEQDSRRSTLALAPLLDIVRRERAPGVVLLCNVRKDGTAGRGSGVVEDRMDNVFEARDATGFVPTGRRPWWEELPPAARSDWATRATRHSGRDRPARIRLALISTKSRDADDPAPLVLELDFTAEPWSVRDVTGELVAAGDASRAAELAEALATRERAADALAAELARRAARGARPLLMGPAEALLRTHDLTSRAARALLKAGGMGRWRIEPVDGRALGLVLLAQRSRESGCDAEVSTLGNIDFHCSSDSPNLGTRMNTERPNPDLVRPSNNAGAGASTDSGASGAISPDEADL